MVWLSSLQTLWLYKWYTDGVAKWFVDGVAKLFVDWVDEGFQLCKLNGFGGCTACLYYTEFKII